MSNKNPFSIMLNKHKISNSYDNFFIELNKQGIIWPYINNEDQTSIKDIYEILKNKFPLTLEDNIKSFCYTLQGMRQRGGWEKWYKNYKEVFIV